MEALPKTKTRSGNCLRSGLTLIEVVVGSAIAGTLLVGVLLSTAAHLRQMKRANRKKAALVQLDQFLAKWSQLQYSVAGVRSVSEQLKQPVVGNLDGFVLDSNNRSPQPALPSSIVLRIRQSTPTLETKDDPSLAIVRIEAIENLGGKQQVLSWIEIARKQRDDVAIE